MVLEMLLQQRGCYLTCWAKFYLCKKACLELKPLDILRGLNNNLRRLNNKINRVIKPKAHNIIGSSLVNVIRAIWGDASKDLKRHQNI